MSTHDFMRLCRVCVAFVADLFCPFRATDVQGWPFTQGGARRLRRLALPWANLFCPFGAWPFLGARPVSSGHGRSLALGRILRGMAGPLGTRPTRSDGPHAPKGQLQISPGQSVAATPRRAALGSKAPQTSIAPKGHDKTEDGM